MENSKKNKFVTRPSRLTFVATAIVFIAIAFAALGSLLLYQRTVSLLTENLRARLQSISITQAANIDSNNINALQTRDDWKKPEWKKVVSRLKKAKDDNPSIVFMYIFRKKKTNPLVMEFVADAESFNPFANTDNDPNNDIDSNRDGKVEPDGADKLNWPGQDYLEASNIPEAYEAYNGPLTVRELYTDSYGQVMTGYAPIRDGSGTTVAVLATDIKADDFLVVTKQTLYPFLGFIAFLTLVILILASILIVIWHRRAESLARLDRQKDELLGMVSHQLAKPITAIKWNLESMIDGDIGNLNPEQKESANTMQSMATNLADLVSMILDVSRIQLGKVRIDPQPLDLNEFFREIVSIIEPTIKEKKINFVQDIYPQKLPTVLLDKRYTRMTIENLVTNAIKYTPDGGTVKLRVQVTNNTLHCSVSDTGCGIPKAEQEKIFGKMYRATNVRNTMDGNGYGLFVAKGAVEGQGGRIWFQSTEGSGTTFFVDLPAKTAEQQSVRK